VRGANSRFVNGIVGPSRQGEGELIDPLRHLCHVRENVSLKARTLFFAGGQRHRLFAFSVLRKDAKKVRARKEVVDSRVQLGAG